jgi:glycosyltransferase involved in cell wall biosynthesis
LATSPERAGSISVIMPVLNAMRYLPQSIPALRAAMDRWPASELIVMDNGSTDGGPEWIWRQKLPRLQFASLPGLTIAGLRNQGAAIARGEVLSFLDADCVIPPDYFHRATAALAESEADAVGCYYRLPPSPSRLELAWDELHAPRNAGFVHLLNAGNFLIRRAAFERAGGFNSALVTGEDAELGLRLEQLGLTQYETQDLVAVHIGNPTSLGQFFRKELWHARGMFGTARLQRIDKPVLMTLVHLGAILLVISILLLAQFSPASIAVGALLLLAVPLAAVLYRARGRSLRYPLTGLMLYFTYFTARICALPLALADAAAPRAGESSFQVNTRRGVS